VHLRMQRFDAPVEHLREPGQFGNILQPRMPDSRSNLAVPSGGKTSFDAEGGEFVGEIYQFPDLSVTLRNATLNFRHEGLCCG